MEAVLFYSELFVPVETIIEIKGKSTFENERYSC